LDLEAGKLVNIVTVICVQNHGFVRNEELTSRGIFPLKRTRFVAPSLDKTNRLVKKDFEIANSTKS
jgi:hypothetical protein